MRSNVLMTFCGNLGSDSVSSGEKSVRFSVAVSGAGKEAPTTWITVFCYQLHLLEWLKKGAVVNVSGMLDVDPHSGRVPMYNEHPTLTVQANSVQIVKFAPQQTSQGSNQPSNSQAGDNALYFGTDNFSPDDDEDIPF